MVISDISLPFFDILLLFFFALVSLDFVYCENDTVDKAFVCYYCIVMALDVAELSQWTYPVDVDITWSPLES